MKGLTAGVFVLGFFSTACGAGGGPELVEWAGTGLHLKIEGSLAGDDLSYDLGEAEASDTTKVWCKREWEAQDDGTGNPDYSTGVFVEGKLDAILDVAGETRRLELEFKRIDLQSASAGDTFTVVPRSETVEPGPTELWMEWEWNDIPVEYEQAAQSGTFVLGELTGEGSTETGGLVIPENTGTFGAFASGKWSETESVAVSFTVNCVDSYVTLLQ